MDETIRDCIGRLALLTYRIEAAKDPSDRQRFTAEMNHQAERLNRLCNPRPIRRESVTNG